MKRPIKIGITLLFLGGAFTTGYWLFKHQGVEEPQLVFYGNMDIRQVNLGFRVFGRLQKLFFEEGDYIKTGQTLALLDPKPSLNRVNAAKAALAEATTRHQNLLKISQRKKKLLSSKFASTEDYENAQATTDEALAQVQKAQAAL